jgi:hypothetical protein
MELTESVSRLREANCHALLTALTASSDFSESSLCGLWTAGLKDIPDTFPFGWYEPPPEGAAVLIGNPPRFERLYFKSLRSRDFWSRPDVALQDASLIYAYSSPIERSTCVIGDVAVTLYLGKEPDIIEHLQKVMTITATVASFAQVGMRLREIYSHADRLIKEAGLQNEVFSVTDPCNFDIGHTVPFSDDGSPPPFEGSASEERGMIAETISKSRAFINAESTTEIKPTMALTIEPRLSAPGFPPVSFHVAVVFDNGRKSIVSGFGGLFRRYGMLDFFKPDDLVCIGI